MPQSGHAVLPAQSSSPAQKDFTPHFITFTTHQRWILPPVARDIVLSCCSHDHRIRYELHVAVIMPDHAHIILTPLIDHQRAQMFSLMSIMQSLKGASARAINQKLNRQGASLAARVFRPRAALVRRTRCKG